MLRRAGENTDMAGISGTNRYVGTNLVEIKTVSVDSKGVKSVSTKRYFKNRKKLSSENFSRFSTHTMTTGQTLDQVAHLFYVNSRLWWVIAEVNNIFNPLDLQDGSELLIPLPQDVEVYLNFLSANG